MLTTISSHLKFNLIINLDAPSKFQCIAGMLVHTCWAFFLAHWVIHLLCLSPPPSLPCHLADVSSQSFSVCLLYVLTPFTLLCMLHYGSLIKTKLCIIHCSSGSSSKGVICKVSRYSCISHQVRYCLWQLIMSNRYMAILAIALRILRGS